MPPTSPRPSTSRRRARGSRGCGRRAIAPATRWSSRRPPMPHAEEEKLPRLTMTPLILIVEDEAPIDTLMRENMEREGVSVAKASDGEEALRLAAERNTDRPQSGRASTRG